jgi:hypothetical protein
MKNDCYKELLIKEKKNEKSLPDQKNICHFEIFLQ